MFAANSYYLTTMAKDLHNDEIRAAEDRRRARLARSIRRPRRSHAATVRLASATACVALVLSAVAVTVAEVESADASAATAHVSIR